MSRTYLIGVVAVGIFGSVLTSGTSQPTENENKVAANPDHSYDRYPSSSSSSEIAGDAITLERSYDGHFYADVEINGAIVHALVDTGASGIALSRDDARKAGLAPSIGMPGVVGEGADGAVHGEYVTLDRVTLGGKTETGMEAIILNSGGQTLLGQSFLSHFASIEMRGDQMVLR